MELNEDGNRHSSTAGIKQRGKIAQLMELNKDGNRNNKDENRNRSAAGIEQNWNRNG